eukprot:ctg_193.g91
MSAGVPVTRVRFRADCRRKCSVAWQECVMKVAGVADGALAGQQAAAVGRIEHPVARRHARAAKYRAEDRMPRSITALMDARVAASRSPATSTVSITPDT